MPEHATGSRAANTYDAFDLRCEVWLMWPTRHDGRFTRSVIRSNIRTIRRMEKRGA